MSDKRDMMPHIIHISNVSYLCDIAYALSLFYTLHKTLIVLSNISQMRCKIYII